MRTENSLFLTHTLAPAISVNWAEVVAWFKPALNGFRHLAAMIALSFIGIVVSGCVWKSAFFRPWKKSFSEMIEIFISYRIYTWPF